MTRKIKIAITTEEGVLLDICTLEIPANHQLIHIISTKSDGEVIGAETEMNIGRNEVGR